jgi:hypothetical protein
MDDASFVAGHHPEDQMKPALALIAITLLATPAIAAGNHSEHASTHQHDCPTVDNCDEDGEAKSLPSGLPMVGAYPTSINDQVN